MSLELVLSMPEHFPSHILKGEWKKPWLSVTETVNSFRTSAYLLGPVPGMASSALQWGQVEWCGRPDRKHSSSLSHVTSSQAPEPCQNIGEVQSIFSVNILAFYIFVILNFGKYLNMGKSSESFSFVLLLWHLMYLQISSFFFSRFLSKK